jgi:hypothetical protein
MTNETSEKATTELRRPMNASRIASLVGNCPQRADPLRRLPRQHGQSDPLRASLVPAVRRRGTAAPRQGGHGSGEVRAMRIPTLAKRQTIAAELYEVVSANAFGVPAGSIAELVNHTAGEPLPEWHAIARPYVGPRPDTVQRVNADYVRLFRSRPDRTPTPTPQLNYDDVLSCFNWTADQFDAAQSLGFPKAVGRRKIRGRWWGPHVDTPMFDSDELAQWAQKLRELVTLTKFTD